MTRPASRRASRLTKLAIALAASAALASCWVPVYDPAASLAMRLERKLEKVTELGPFPMNEWEARKGYFLPHRTLAPVDGFWIARPEERIRVRYLAEGLTYWGSWESGYNALGGGFSAVALTDAAASGLSTSVFKRGLGLVYETGGYTGIYLDATNNFIPDPGILVGGINPRIVGAYASPSGPNTLELAALQYSTQDHELWGGATTIAASSAFAPSTANISQAKPNVYYGLDLKPGAFFAWNTSDYFLSGRLNSDDSLVTIRWNAGLSDSSPTLLSGVDRQLTDILYDDRLLARGELTTIVYSNGGTRLFEIPTGSLRFVHELYDMATTTWYCYFSRSTYVYGKDDSGQLYVEVFRIPSASLSDLAQ